MKLNKLVLTLTAVFCVAIAVVSYTNITLANPVVAQYHHKPQIILDIGHGGADGGAEGVGGVVEKHINLQIGLILADMLRINGYEVLLTRADDSSIHNEGVKGIKAQKTSDLHNRLSLMKQNPNAIVISIHQNKFQQSKYSGLQVFYGTQTPELSAQFAQIIQERTRTALQSNNQRQIKEGYKTLYLLRNAPQPIVLVECGFLSNPQEAALLQNTDYQKQLALILLASTMEFTSQV